MLAGLINACRVTGRALDEVRVVLLGVGAAGVAIARILVEAGIGDVVAVDRQGILGPRVSGTGADQRWVAAHTNHDLIAGDLRDALRGTDALVGVSRPNLVRPEWVATMSHDAMVFALANPVPEIMPEQVPGNVAIVATGRSDYPNQINNALVFPGFFRGLLDSRARAVTPAMKIAAAHAVADVVAQDGPSEDYVVPSIFDRRVVPAVAAAVATVAHAARRDRLAA